ncbi:MAG: carbon-nitrogen hydrolase family protein [Chloroflexota bacterium]
MPAPQPSEEITVAMAQIAPIWLDRTKTIAKVAEYVHMAAEQGCQLVTFGEALVPGYPFWLSYTGGAEFNAPTQKEIHAHYMQQAVSIESDHLQSLCNIANQRRIAIVLGCVERAADRGGHSLYAALVYINAQGQISTVHRKLMPTYEERLTWAPGDGHGLRVHPLGPFTLGGLNCWENWMPLARAALYGQGEDFHVALWPGRINNTQDCTRFLAMEGRSYVLSTSGLFRPTDISSTVPHREEMLTAMPDSVANGGSCIAGPDGSWVVAPVVDEERLITAVLNHRRVREERQNFDPAGHYARPDVTQLTVHRQRQRTVYLED